MNTEQITQIIETIKTLNFNIDSQSAIEITNTITPLLWIYVLKGYFIAILTFSVISIIIFLVYKIIMRIIEEESKNKVQ